MSWSSACLLTWLLGLGVSAAAESPDSESRLLVPRDAEWHYLRGLEEPPADWRSVDFDDGAWEIGPAGFGYGDDDDATLLEDMRGSYLSVYLRRDFVVEDAARLKSLSLAIAYDDGFVAYLNGEEVARRLLDGQPPSYNRRAEDHEARGLELIELPGAEGLLQQGRNVLAIQAHNSALSSSDFTCQAELRATETEPDAPQVDDYLISDDEGDVERLPGVMHERPWDLRTTIEGWSRSNYFQARAGSPKTSVIGLKLEQQAEYRPRSIEGLRLIGTLGIDRVGSLGTTKRGRFDLRLSRGVHRFSWELSSTRDRPAFVRDDEVETSDSWGSAFAYSNRRHPDLEVEVHAGYSREDPEGDPGRFNEGLTGALDLRFMRRNRKISPELIYERRRRRADQDQFEYDQDRYSLRLHSSPTRRLYMSLTYRRTEREYTTAEPSDRNFGRRDQRDFGRFLWSLRAAERVTFAGLYSYERGESSRDARVFEDHSIYANVTLHF